MQTPHSDLPELEKMRIGTAASYTCRVRGFSVQLRVLSVSETINATTAAADKLLEMPETARHRISEHVLIAKETLKLASTPDVDSKQAPKLNDYLLDRMTNDEINAIFKEYTAIVDRVNPSLEFMKPEDMEALVAGLKKKQEEGTPELDSALTELSSWERLSLARYLLTRGD